MDKNQIFIGTIRKCTQYEMHPMFENRTYFGDQCIGFDCLGYTTTSDEVYKENAILIKLKNGFYVDLNQLDSILDCIKIYRPDRYRLGGLAMSTSADHVGSLFVDTDSLKPYYEGKQNSNHVSVYQLKKQVEYSK